MDTCLDSIAVGFECLDSIAAGFERENFNNLRDKLNQDGEISNTRQCKNDICNEFNT